MHHSSFLVLKIRWGKVDSRRKSIQSCLYTTLYNNNSNFENFKVYFTSAIDKISKESKIAVLVGDFNINLLKYDTHSDTAEFLNTLGSYCFQPHIAKPTRITDHSATLIDHIYFNSMEHRTISGNILCDITDHPPNFLIINKFSYNFANSKTVIYRRDYSNFASYDFLNEVKSVHWEEVFPAQADASVVFDSFHAKITEIVDKHVPLKKVLKRQLLLSAKPWITRGIKIYIKIKNSLYKSYLKTRNNYYFSKYKFYRNKLKHLIQVSKKTYYQHYFVSKTKNIKDTWK